MANVTQTNSNKRTKKIMGWLVVCCMIVFTGIGICIGYVIWFHKHPTPSSPKPIVVNKDIDNKYLVDEYTSIQWTSDGSAKFGHKLLNLKALSDDNDQQTFFTIDGTVNFGLLLDPSMDCHLSGVNDATVICANLENDSESWTAGLVIGTKGGITDGVYRGHIELESNVIFNVHSSNASYVFGLLSYNVSFGSIINVSSTFVISSSSLEYGVGAEIYGVDMIGANGSINIDGTFIISSLTQDIRIIWIENLGYKATLNIDGVFTASGGNNCDVLSIQYVSPYSHVNIDGVFSIECDGYVRGCVFAYIASLSHQNIGGVFTIHSNLDLSLIYFQDIEPNSVQNINGIFVGSSQYQCVGIQYGYSQMYGSMTIDAAFIISGVNVFALFVDNVSALEQNSIAFGENNKFILHSVENGEEAGTIYSSNSSLPNTTNQMNVFGNKSSLDDNPLPSYVTYIPALDLILNTDATIVIDTILNVSFFQYYTTSSIPNASTKEDMKNALQNYIQQSFAPQIGKNWIKEILDFLN